MNSTDINNSKAISRIYIKAESPVYNNVYGRMLWHWRCGMKALAVLAVVCFAGVLPAMAQNDRAFIREGNRLYRQKQWTKAETSYRKAVAKNHDNAQAVYNLGCALMMQGKDSLAMLQYNQAQKIEKIPMRRAKSFHNMGVILQNHRQYGEAMKAYAEALRLNPNDNETRYNYVLCKYLMKHQPPQNNNQNKNNKNKNKNKNNKQQQNKNDKDKNKNNKDKNNQNKNQQNQPKMSKENAEQLLNAAIQQENATKQKLKSRMAQPQHKQLKENW